MLSMHVRCLAAAAVLALAATAVPVLAAAMTLIVVAGVVVGVGSMLSEWFSVEAPESEAGPAPSLPKIPLRWV